MSGSHSHSSMPTTPPNSPKSLCTPEQETFKAMFFKNLYRHFRKLEMTAMRKTLNISPNNVTEKFEDWTIHCSNSHILPSKCTGPCNDGCRCAFCFFTEELQLPHLPEMVYPNNKLVITHASGLCIEFNAVDALKLVKSKNQSVKIACAEDWRRSRQETGLVDKTVGDFDWTFTTDYKGTWKNCQCVETTEAAIDTDKLKKREEILLYRDIVLFEDELHDNGIALCSVRIRVMPSGFFVLLRFFLRVDGVILSVNDTRMYHEFGTDSILTEFTHREGKVSELRLPLYIMNEPDEVTPLLPLKHSVREKLTLVKGDGSS